MKATSVLQPRRACKQNRFYRARVEKETGNLKLLAIFSFETFAERTEYLEKVLFEFKQKQETKSTGRSGSSGSSAGLLDSNIHMEAEKPTGVECFFWKLKP